MVRRPTTITLAGRVADRTLMLLGAIVATLLCFLVLPLMQSISKPPDADTLVRSIDSVALPPPPPPLEEPPKEEPSPDDKPPELQPEAQPLDLSQLELALGPTTGGGWMQGDFGLEMKNLAANASAGGDVDALFSVADLDQKPRILYQTGAALDARARRKTPGTVYLLFLVDQDGRVQNPMVQSASDPVFERPALAAIKQWKFEPGKRNGKPVRFRMRVPITFKE